jgi:hypothetical protein
VAIDYIMPDESRYRAEASHHLSHPEARVLEQVITLKTTLVDVHW